jgi:hypothetical protein
MRRQVLIDRADAATASSLSALTEEQLKEKANFALTLMESKMEGATVVGAKKLVNGGVVFDCKDDATATWLKGGAVVLQFVAALGGNCVYRPRKVELVAEMLPIGARIEEAGLWRVVEGESGLGEGSILGARWLKAIDRRSPGQKLAHAKIEFATAEAANHAIDHGFYLQGRNIRVRKSEEEAKRCVKCQKFDGHLAFACKETQDVCGRCAENHRTSDCTVTDTGTFRCSNCKVSGHGAVDRSCPFFLKEQGRWKARDVTAGYRYIPTADPKTWVTTAGAAVTATSEGMSGGVSGGYGRLAGGFSGQGGGAPPVDDGWAGRARRMHEEGNGWSRDGTYQPTIADAFVRGSQAQGRAPPRREEAPQRSGEGDDDGTAGLSPAEAAAVRAVNNTPHIPARQSQSPSQRQQNQVPAGTVGGAQ